MICSTCNARPAVTITHTICIGRRVITYTLCIPCELQERRAAA